MNYLYEERRYHCARRLIDSMSITHAKTSGRYVAVVRGPQRRNTRTGSRARGHETQASPR